MSIGTEELKIRFTYHPPKDGQQGKYETLRNRAKNFARTIDKLCPDSREKSLAMTELESVVMWANASIARRE